MESGDGASSSTGNFLPVPVSSDDFLNSILAQLQSAYLFEESKHSFKYTAAFLIKNSALEEKYKACREKRRKQGYIDEDLKETYGFLLFDELGKAKSIGETGLVTGTGTCTTLGDPTKGVYLSMYSDCLDLNRWYHGKSGYIVILRLTQGRVKKVSENYTQNLTEPTLGFDCHVSEQLPSVSSKTSSFLAFERTQYYLYELLENERIAQSPSLACPYAIVEFSYTDTKETQQEKSKAKKIACPYSPWMGKLQIGSHIFSVGIRSTTGALTRAKTPPVIKAEWVISMLDLRKLLPKAIFDTTVNGKALQGDLECSLCEIVASSSEEKEKLSPVLLEIKEKDVALVISLSDGGFLLLIHGSHFVFHDNDNVKTTNKVLQGVIVFPVSQAIQTVTKNYQTRRRLPSDALHVLPLLTYAEGEIEKTSLNANEDLCDTFVHYMQSYATLISPGLPSSPFREVSIFPDQYDVSYTHGHLYSTPEWTDKQWQSLKLYLKNANSFQLPVNKASEIFVTGQEARREDLEDDIYICLSSPEEPSTSLISAGSENKPDQKCSTNDETPQDTPQPVSRMESEAICETSKKLSTKNKCTETELPLRPEEPSEELIVSITSAAPTVGEDSLDMMKHQLSVTADLETATLNSLSEIVHSKMALNCSNDVNMITDSEKLSLGQNLEAAQSPSFQIVKTLLGKDESFCLDKVTTQELEKDLDMPETQGNKQENDKSSLKTTHGSEQAVDISLNENVLLKELETCTLRKKSERWGLKPVISTCGRIFIPFGSVDPEQIQFFQEKLRLTKHKMHPDERTADALVGVSNASMNKQETRHNEEATKPTEEGHHKKKKNDMNSDKNPSTNDADNLCEEPNENHMKDIRIAEKPKSEIMLKKLKSVILKKRNTDLLRNGLSINDNLDTDPSPKRTRRDTTSEIMKNSSDICAKETNVDNQDLTYSVDPIFAHALGLTPKGTLDTNFVQRNDPSVENETILAKEDPSCKQQQPQSSPKALRPRLKMLKKNQSLSEEQVKKKWWLHFQTPTCYGEKQYEGCSRDISVRKTVKEKKDTSSEALNLLADLALSANKEQVSPHPVQVCLQEFGSSLKKCEITNDASNSEQQSVLHALLRQPASKHIQPSETPSPDSFGSSELVDVICQEHAYSLPSFPSLLLALPAPFQVSPLNGSSRLLHTQRHWNGAPTIHPIISSDDTTEGNRRDPGEPKRSWYKRKFCLIRTIVSKERSVQVTRHWEGTYNFNLDSRFTVDPKDKAVVRALHGPWDFSIHDTTEEVQLIVHMWIGLFYSRSTARFFHLDPDVTLASSEEIFVDAKDASNEKGQEQSVAENVLSTPFSNEKKLETVESSSLLNVADKIEAKILDLSKPKNCYLDEEPVVLNLSQRSSHVESANQSLEMTEKAQAPVQSTLNPQGLQATLPLQWCWNLIPTAGNAMPLKYVGVPVNEKIGNSELNHQLFFPVWNEIPNANIWTNNDPKPEIPIAESNDPETENASIQISKAQDSPIRKRGRRKRTRKDLNISVAPHTTESQENKNMQQVKENLPNLNKSSDTSPAIGDVDTMKSKPLLEIKKKYMGKLASINQHTGCPTSQNNKEMKNCTLLKKLLQEEPKPQQPSKSESLPSQSPELNNSSCENVFFNEGVVQRQHVFAFPKAFTASVVTETTCAVNKSEQNSFNFVGSLASLVSAENGPCTSILDSVSVSSVKEKSETAGQCVAKGCLPEFVNLHMNIIKQDSLIENSLECNLSQDENLKTFEASLNSKTNISNTGLNDEAENNSGSVTIPFIGIDTPIEDMLKSDTSNEMDKEKSEEDMESATYYSSSGQDGVNSPVKKWSDNTNHDHSSKPIESPEESKVNNAVDTGDGEADDRCPTPTIDEQPYVYTTQPNPNDSGNDLDEASQDCAEKDAERTSTPVLDETSVKPVEVLVTTDAMTKVSPQSDIEIRTLRTLQCLDEYLSTIPYKTSRLGFNSKHNLNASVAANKKSSALIHDFEDVQRPSTLSCPPQSTQYSYVSSSNDVLDVMKHLKEKSSIFVPSVPGMLSMFSSKPISSTEKPDHSFIFENETPKSNSPSRSPIMCPDATERPSNTNLVQMMNTQSKPIKFSIKKTKQGHFVCSGPVFAAQTENCMDTIVPMEFAPCVQKDAQTLKCTEPKSSSLPTQSTDSVQSIYKSETGDNTQPKDKHDTVENQWTDEGDLLNCTTSFVDSKTNKITDDSLGTEGSLSCTVTNTKRKGSSFLEKVSQRCLEDDSTQFSMDQECLIFLDQMKLLIKRKNQCFQVHCDQPNQLSSSPMKVHFSQLKDEGDVLDDIQIPFKFFDQKISVDMSDREQSRDSAQQSSSKSQPNNILEQPGVSAITAECARLYRDIMNKICSGNGNNSLLKDLHKIDSGDSTTNSCNYFDFCSQMKREMDDSFRNSLNSVVKKSSKIKNRFFLLVTSDDVFFSKTKEYLEAEGHIAVQPSNFFFRDSGSSPLLVIIRNEDIAENIFKVPNLLQLRKDPVVQFAGIDEPDDVVNLTYQEVFIKGGFVMFDRAAVESLNSGNVRKILEILQRLTQTGKWKWLLHYRDSRRLKENARLCPDAKEKNDLLNQCKEDGLLDILPYHECDLMSREQPNYLQCLCHQQIQNISTRYPVFVSDSEPDRAFEKNGIVTMTVSSFLMDSLSEINSFT